MVKLSSFLTPFSVSILYTIATSILSKAIISKWSTDDNHALGMSVAITSYGAGTVMGPALSGFLADPLNQYNIMVTSKLLSCTCHTVTMGKFWF